MRLVEAGEDGVGADGVTHATGLIAIAAGSGYVGNWLGHFVLGSQRTMN